MSPFARLPAPPYYVVCFSSRRTPADDGYGEMAAEMERLSEAQPGFLGAESARNADGFGITNAYWETEDAIRAWKQQVDHLSAQRLGRSRWYDHYEVRVAKVERAYGFEKTES